MAYPFTDLWFLSSYHHGHVVQWALDPLFSAPAPFSFVLQLMEDSTGESIIYSAPATSTYFARDDSNKRSNFVSPFYYRVRLTTGDNHVYFSNTLDVLASKEDTHHYLLARDIVRREFIRFRYTGHDGYLLKQKNYGEIVPGSVDPISGLPIVEGGTAFGTRFSGGYYSGVKLRFSMENVKQQFEDKSTGMGITASETMKIRMVGFPLSINQDILVDNQDERWILDEFNVTYFPGTQIPLVQSGLAKHIQSQDPLYKLPV